MLISFISDHNSSLICSHPCYDDLPYKERGYKDVSRLDTSRQYDDVPYKERGYKDANERSDSPEKINSTQRDGTMHEDQNNRVMKLTKDNIDQPHR
ncbi:hypothetical protein IX83_06650 [Basilea psittacipulmonis DSM 24701]|uniref:Uncharacterized protein n=1 Tax=Basilea psittacipulmonis DSM 24701 TaxID=1072685 RepID=A0A077DIM8_9BURK|nr:hypothetical protein IX83_06650 [Basilea psittacipulmonis DSM 24701]